MAEAAGDAAAVVACDAETASGDDFVSALGVARAVRSITSAGPLPPVVAVERCVDAIAIVFSRRSAGDNASGTEASGACLFFVAAVVFCATLLGVEDGEVAGVLAGVDAADDAGLFGGVDDVGASSGTAPASRPGVRSATLVDAAEATVPPPGVWCGCCVSFGFLRGVPGAAPAAAGADNAALPTLPEIAVLVCSAPALGLAAGRGEVGGEV